MQLAYPISLAVVVSSVSILIWVWFWTRKQDLHNESVIFTFIGGAATVLLSLPFQKAIGILIPETTVMAVVLWATVEEILKLSVVLLAIKFFKLDRAKSIIYMIIAALGFAALENILFIVGPLIGEDITRGAITGNLRFIGASLLHVVSSSIIGIALAFSFHKSTKARAIITTLALILAIVIHSAYNLVVIHWGDWTLAWFSIIWILALVLVYIIFRKGKRLPKKEVGTFVLIIILFVSMGSYLNTVLPKYTPEVLASWQAALENVETSQKSFEEADLDFLKSRSLLDSMHTQLRSVIMTIQENEDFSIELRQFMDNYKGSYELVYLLKDLEETEDIHSWYANTYPNFHESAALLDDIYSQLKEVVNTIEDGRDLSRIQRDFLDYYDTLVEQFNCIHKQESMGEPTYSCLPN